MEYRKLTEDEQTQIIAMMTASGFTLSPADPALADIVSGLHFTIPLSAQDEENIKRDIGKNHFTPLGYRSVAVFANYVTSHVRGTYRAYRAHYANSSHDTHNIFAYVQGENNPVESVRIFLGMYERLEYNRH